MVNHFTKFNAVTSYLLDVLMNDKSKLYQIQIDSQKTMKKNKKKKNDEEEEKNNIANVCDEEKVVVV